MRSHNSFAFQKKHPTTTHRHYISYSSPSSSPSSPSSLPTPSASQRPHTNPSSNAPSRTSSQPTSVPNPHHQHFGLYHPATAFAATAIPSTHSSRPPRVKVRNSQLRPCAGNIGSRSCELSRWCRSIRGIMPGRRIRWCWRRCSRSIFAF